jgi:hypothetical protein
LCSCSNFTRLGHSFATDFQARITISTELPVPSDAEHRKPSRGLAYHIAEIRYSPGRDFATQHGYWLRREAMPQNAPGLVLAAENIRWF